MGAPGHMPSARQFSALADGLYSIGFSMLEADRWKDAADVFRAMVLTAPRDERSWVALGKCHEELGQADVAVELYSLGTLCIPDGVRCRIALSRALRERGDDLNAESVMDAAAALAADSDDDDLRRLTDAERSGA